MHYSGSNNVFLHWNANTPNFTEVVVFAQPFVLSKWLPLSLICNVIDIAIIIIVIDAIMAFIVVALLLLAILNSYGNV